ncbi:MAG: PAS domain-containing protein [Cryomorphaceae bacterium]|nr:PAS domain-containing protein [Cryomorphaceae bacterium]
MNRDLSYEDLLKSYRDLQLRTTRFAFVEQQLINTRDRLDSELELYKKLHDFNSRALREQSPPDFFRLLTEAIVDLFEVESAIVYFEKTNDTTHSQLYLEGYRPTGPIDKATIISDLKSIADSEIPISNFGVRAEDFQKLDHLSSYAEGLFFCFTDSDLNYSTYLLGCTSIAKLPLYSRLENRHRTIFSVFSKQAQSLVSNRIKSNKIQRQIETITASEIELRKLSLISTKTKNGVIITDKFGCIEWVNQSFSDTTGYTLEEVIGKKPKDFLQGDSSDQEAIQKLREALLIKKPIEVTLINHRKDGGTYYNQLEITPVFDDLGNHVNFIALQKDITSEIIAQQEILRINSRFELITAKSNIGIWEMYPKTGKLAWNEHLVSQYGATINPLEPHERFWEKAILSDDLERIRREVYALYNQDADIFEDEVNIKRLDNGAQRILKIMTIVERDENDEVLRLVGTSIDITEEREAERKLKASEEKYRTIIDNMNLGLMEVDTFGTVVFSNKKFREMAQATPIESLMLTQDVESVLIQKLGKGEIIEYRKIDEGAFEISLQTSNDTLVHYLISSGPTFNQQKQIAGQISIYLDITDLKSIQQDVIEKNNELHKINHELDNFVYSISHDLRSPILSIKGILGLVIDNNTLTESDQRYLALAVESSERLDGTIKEILDYSRNARLELQFSNFDITEMVTGIFNDLRFTDNESLSLSLQMEGNKEICSDHYRMSTLLKNLISNAVKYRRHVNDSYVKVDIQHTAEKLTIAISDNGEGISAKNLKKIFEMFYRASSSATGTGLGLYICKEIINKLSGKINVKSELGKGSTFEVEIMLQHD